MEAKRLLCTGILVAMCLGAQTASADTASYSGAHAIPEGVGGKFCYVQVAHTHTYLPDESLQARFIEHADPGAHFEFVGDPGEYQFEGMRVEYFGPHPLHFDGSASEAEGLCRLRGEHSHLRAPASPGEYEVVDGVYYFGSRSEARRADRKARRTSRSSPRKRSTRSKVSTTRSGTSSRPATAPSPAPSQAPVSKPSKPTKSKSPDPHRSWMNRRLGR